VQPPLVLPNVDGCDAFQAGGCPEAGQTAQSDYGGSKALFKTGPSLNEVLTDEQEALLGCGHFYGSGCEVDGVDLFDAEASVVLQAFLGGTALATSGAQPGTTGLQSPPVALRDAASGAVVLPGARGPADPSYDPFADGCSAPGAGACEDAHALETPGSFGTAGGEAFANELAALSFDLQLALAELSAAPGAHRPRPPVLPSEFDLENPYSTVPAQCSWAQPQLCTLVANLESYATELLDDDPSGPPRVRWLWESGAVYQVTGLDGQSGTADDPALGIAYGVVPEPRPVLLQRAAVATLIVCRKASASA